MARGKGGKKSTCVWSSSHAARSSVVDSTSLCFFSIDSWRGSPWLLPWSIGRTCESPHSLSNTCRSSYRINLRVQWISAYKGYTVLFFIQSPIYQYKLVYVILEKREGRYPVYCYYYC